MNEMVQCRVLGARVRDTVMHQAPQVEGAAWPLEKVHLLARLGGEGWRRQGRSYRAEIYTCTS